ncbi:MAG: sugar phosphate isomerase/epimerase [Anaerolineae bacterium]|nr:sugar phosphate isomerase/epimerase [Anaerolineae bacterium]
MKLAIQHTMLSGQTLEERFQKAAQYSFAGVELAVGGFSGSIFEHLEEIQSAIRNSGLPVSSICTTRADDLITPDPAERAERKANMIRLLQLAEELGATGVVCVPIRPPSRLPDLSPLGSEDDLIEQLLVITLQEIIAETADLDAAIFLEPLNRYETRFLRTLSHAARIGQKVGHRRVRVLADFFHMNIEETDIPAAIQSVSSRIGHVHLADSNRLLPGYGHIDFNAGLRALKQSGFNGWMTLECGIPGNPDKTLPESIARMRDYWKQA